MPPHPPRPDGRRGDCQAALTLLAAGDPAPVALCRHGSRFPALLVCDHASREIPAVLADLGVPEQDRRRHIAWDIGARDLAIALGEALGVDVVLAGYSRLVIDCNRHPSRPGSIVEASDGTVVRGNLGLAAEGRAARLSAIFEPYHGAIDAELAGLAARVAAPALIAVHSFTDRMAGQVRPWHCGVLWGEDGRLALPLMSALAAEPGLVVGDNLPYSGRDPDNFTVDHHARRLGRPYVCIEVRQDLLADGPGVAAWAARLAAALARPLADPLLYRRWAGAAGGEHDIGVAADHARHRGGVPVRRSGDG